MKRYYKYMYMYHLVYGILIEGAIEDIILLSAFESDKERRQIIKTVGPLRRYINEQN